MEDSRKSSESECSSSSVGDTSSDEEHFPAKKPSPSCHDSDQSASSVCPTLSIASSESATVLRRSLRKIIEESKRDAVSSSVSNSRESTPPRMSNSGRRISSRQVFTPGSSSRLSKNSSEGLGTRSSRGGVTSSESAGVAKQLDFQRRSTRVRRIKRNVRDDASTSMLSGSIMSSDDDSCSVKESSRVYNSVSDLNMITDITRLTSRVDTSDTDSRASSLCAYNTRSGTLGEVLAARVNSRGGASAKPSCIGASTRQKAGKRSRVFKCVADELAKLQSSDSETDGQTSVSQTPFFDPFPDNSSNSSSICSSLPAPELSADRSVDNCKNAVGSSSQAKDTSTVMLDPDKADSKKTAELDTEEKAEISAKSRPNAAKETVSAEVPGIQSGLLNKVTCVENEKAVYEDSVSNKDQLLDESRSIQDKVVETKQEAKDASLTVNSHNLETDKDDKKVKECADDADELRVMDHTVDGEEEPSSHSKVVTCGGSEEQDEKLKEEIDDVSDVKEEPPEILVSSTDLLYVYEVSHFQV